VKANRTGTVLFSAALAVAAASTAHAQESIKPGKWEYTVTLQMPNMPQLPPGVQLPPNVQMPSGAGGMTATHTSCVNASDPTAELRRPQGPPGSPEAQCKVERMERSGGIIIWASTCTSPEATVHSEGRAKYSDDRMEADFNTRTTHANGPPIQAAQHVVGRYLGACDGR
jgi:Protein of unknown function (DUF3617)